MTYTPSVRNKISTLNVRAASTMAPGEIYQGTGEDVSKYGRVGISINSTNKTRGVLTIEVSDDNVNWGGPDRDWEDTRFGAPHMWNIVEKYFRIKYTNGPFEAENLSIQVQYSVNADIFLGHQLNGILLDETEASVTRALLVGRKDDGKYRNVSLGERDALRVTDDYGHLLLEILAQLKLLVAQNNEVHDLNMNSDDIEG